jgi:hypothetical protein
MSADLIGGLVNAGISLVAGTYFFSLGRGSAIPPVALQGKRWLVPVGLVIALVGVVNAAVAVTGWGAK